MTTLEDRFNPTHWAALLDSALPAIDAVYGKEPGKVWTLGGGTALALRIGHRLSDDIDIFVPGIGLKSFTPQHNPAARDISASFQWPGHYLKFETPHGEVDFLSPMLQTEPGYTLEKYKGRTLALETAEEVIVKKVRFRSGSFKHRDAFDLAAVASRDPAISSVLAKETRDLLPVLAQRINNLARDKSAVDIRPTETFRPLSEIYLDKASEVIEDARWKV